MPRNGSGSYSVPNSFTPNTVMAAAEVNENFTDAGTALTGSLARDGQSSMTGQLPLWEGTSTASVLPGIAFGLDPNTGFRLASSDEMRWVAGGSDRFYIDSVGNAYQLGDLQVTGTVSLSSPIVIATSSASLLTLRRTENAGAAATVEQYESGDGSGAKGDLQVVNDSANGVSTMRWRINSAAVFEQTGSLFTHATDVAIGSNLRADTDGYWDFTEISAPASPDANKTRLYAVDSGGASRLAFKDSAGAVAVLGAMTDRQIFDASGTWTKPAGATVAFIQAWGAGGSGGRGGSGDGGGGGGGGGYTEKWMAVASLSAAVSVTIGAGGASITADDTDGATGGDSTFGAYLSAFGGAGGNGDNAGDNGGGGGGGVSGAGGAPSGAAGGLGGALAGNIGGVSTAAVNNANPFGGGGGASAGAGGGGGLYGGGGGGMGSGTNTETAGGASVFGGGGGGGGSDTGTGAAGGAGIIYGGSGGAGNTGASNATAGTAPAGGGGGSETGNSGAGAAGRVIVTVW